MRVLVIYANPVRSSFGATLHGIVLRKLTARGHQCDDCDLYAEAFNPVLSEKERSQYHDTQLNRLGVEAYAERVLAADAIVLAYPVWNEGFPAILKGFFDRVFVPGVSFNIGKNGAVAPNLRELKRLAAVCTYGADRLSTILMGDPPRRVVKRLIRSMAVHHVACEYLACYGMNKCTQERRARFLKSIEANFEAW
jgi:NAD(P)H dehydrogenase (quinone)